MFKANFFTSKKKKLANAEAFTQEGRSLVQSNDYNGAIVAYTKSIQAISTNGESYVNRAEAYRLLGNYTLCIEDCDKAIGMDPKKIPAYCTKAHALLGMKRVDDALKCSATAVELSKTSPNTDSQTQARQMHTMLTDTKNKYLAEKYKRKGDEILNSKHDFQKAIEAYTKAISYVSNKFSYYNNRALAYLLYGEYEFAIYDCDKSLAILPNGKAYGRKAAALCDLDRADEALVAIDQALTLLPENEELLNTQRTIVEKVSAEHSFKEDKVKIDFASMTLTCTLALKHSKLKYAHYNNRALAHLGSRDFEKAIKDCETSLKIKNNMKAYRNLALIYCEQSNVVEAFAAIKMQREVNLECEKIQMSRECQLREENTLEEDQIHARASRLTRKQLRMEKQAKRVRTNYAKLFGKKMVRQGLKKYLIDYSAIIATYKVIY